MEIAIQELEMAHGLQAPRTGDPSQLKARILGLKCRQQEYYNIITIQQDDIAILKKDTRVSFTKEASMERDVFAAETRRLQKIIRRLRVVYHKVCLENTEVARLRGSIAKLKIKITKIEMVVKNSKSIIEQMKEDIAQAKLDSSEAQKGTENAISKIGELESHSLVLQNMLAREKEEATQIHKQTSTLGKQIRIVKKENADRAIQATLAAGMLASNAKKGKGGFKRSAKMGKLKLFDEDSTSATPTSDLSAVHSNSSPSSPATPSSQSTVNKDFNKIHENYIKAIGKATNTFVETAHGSSSPRAKPHLNIDSPSEDHFKYEQLQETFQKDVTDAENTFMDMMDELEYGAARPRKDLEAEAKGLRAQMEALQKQQMDLVNKWLSNLTIELDNNTLSLKSGEYVLDVNNAESKTRVKITSPDKSPEALARKKAEEEARKKREAEEAVKRAAEEEARKKRIAQEEAARRVAEEEARKKREAEDEARRKKMMEEDEAARKKREAEEVAAKKKREAEEDEAARKKKEAEEIAAKKKREAEEEDARRKRDAAVGSSGKAQVGGEVGEKEEFFTEEMQGTIKENIKEVLSHLEVISSSVQQKGASGSSGVDAAKKIEKPPDPSKS